MKSVLVIGSGGREHALGWKLSKSAEVSRVCVAPGNDGYPSEWERWELSDFSTLAARAKQEGISLVVIGPDHALADGAVDAFMDVGVPAFGPTKAAARLEASKAFAKDVMIAAQVPTARYGLVRSESEAYDYLENARWDEGRGFVIKADGLAFGKGVRVCSGIEEASAAISELLPISGSLVIEEKLQGEEVSWLAFCDGERAALLEPARDFKRVKDQDLGPNTGGMGAFSPVPGLPAGFSDRMEQEVFTPILKEMKRRGTPFKGVLYAGLMVDLKNSQYWVLEFNTRFGDPETQVLLPRLIDTPQANFYDWCLASAQGELSRLPARVPFSKEAAVVVIGAADGYPEKPLTGAPLKHPALLEAPEYFLAGVKKNSSGQLTVSGGRVLGALGMASTLKAARSQAYERLREVSFSGMHFRQDIAQAAQAGEEHPG